MLGVQNNLFQEEEEVAKTRLHLLFFKVLRRKKEEKGEEGASLLKGNKGLCLALAIKRQCCRQGVNGICGRGKVHCCYFM